MRPLTVLSVLALIAAPSAAQLADYNFDNHTLVSTANSPLATASEITPQLNFMFGSGNLCLGQEWYSPTPQGPNTGSQAYVEFTVTPNGTCPLAFSTLTIETWRGSGVTDWVEFGALYADEVSGPGGNNFQTLLGSADIFPQASQSGSVSFDLSGFAFLQGVVTATKFRIYFWGDANSCCSNAEVNRIALFGGCLSVPVCGPGYAQSVLGAAQGANGTSTQADPTAVLGNDPATKFNTGQGGFVAVSFNNVFTNTGAGMADLFVDEGGTPDCNRIAVRAADNATAARLQAAGLVADSNGFYEFPQTYCGDAMVDFDQFVPGLTPDTLRLDGARVRNVDTAGNGAEICLIRAEAVCDLAKLGNRVWVDVNNNGLQDALELGVPQVPVRLLAASGLELQTTTTDADGNYCFWAAPGTYRVCFAPNQQLFSFTTPNAGSDPELNSDALPGTGCTDLLSLSSGQVRTDVDAGLILACPGVSAFVSPPLSACGIPQEPVIGTLGAPVIGTLGTITIDSPFPNSLVVLFGSFGPPTPQIFNFPFASCTIFVNLNALMTVAGGFTDANGHWEQSFPILPDPSLAGVELTLQARVCDPTQPGPIPGFPDWFSSALHLRIGCPQ